MRHASVTTTEKHHVGMNAAETAAMLASLVLNDGAAPAGDTTPSEGSAGDT
ncbi:MAG: hypothetical protein ACK50J_04840 [Planctomyces sp.]